MINGIDPILIFQFSRPITPALQASLKDINILSKYIKSVYFPPIPIYLSEQLTGIYVLTQDKSIEIETNTSTLGDGTDPFTTQRGIQSSVKVTMNANNGSIGMILLSALMDQVFPLVTAKGATITYLNGAVTIFNGLLHSFQINQDTNSTLMTISMEIVKGSKGAVTTVPAPAADTSISNAGTVAPSPSGVPAGSPIPPPATGPGPGGGASVPIGSGRLG